MTIFKKPVFFAENRNAKIILMLCAEDNERHLGIMNDILRIVQNENFTDIMTTVESPEDVIESLRELLR